MKFEETVWSEGALMICTKCGTRREECGQKNWTADWAENTKMSMKKSLKEKGLAKSLRVMTASCLGLCPEGEQAVMFLQKQGEGVEKVKTLVFNPEADPQGLQKYTDIWLKERGK